MMSVQKRKKSPQENGVENGTVSATFKKALKAKSIWEDKVCLVCVIFIILILVAHVKFFLPCSSIKSL